MMNYSDPLDDLAWDSDKNTDAELRRILEALSPRLKVRLQYWIDKRISDAIAAQQTLAAELLTTQAQPSDVEQSQSAEA